MFKKKFYQEDKINTVLLCSHCDKKFVDPRSLPCGESYCKNCIIDLVNESNLTNDQFKCKSADCDATHQLPKEGGGFPKNKKLIQLLEQTPNEVSRGKGAQSLITSLELLRNEIQALENLKTANSNPLIQEHCSNLICEVDAQTEILKHDIDQYRDELFSKIAKYEQDCIDSVEKINTDDDFVKLIEEKSEFVEEWDEKLGKYELDDDEVEVAVQKSAESLKSIEQFLDDRNISFFKNKRLTFRPNNSQIQSEPGVLGELIIEMPETMMREFDNYRDINLKDMAPIDVNGKISVEAMENGNFFVVYLNLDKKSTKYLYLKNIDLNGGILSQINYYKGQEMITFRTCCNKNTLFLFIEEQSQNKTLNVLDQASFKANRPTLFTTGFGTDVLAMAANDCHLFLLTLNTIFILTHKLEIVNSVDFSDFSDSLLFA